jgi:hypothetical protein
VSEISTFKAARSISFASTVGPLSLFLSGASLARLAIKQAQLVENINSRAPSLAVLQPSAGADSVHLYGPSIQPVHWNTFLTARRRTSRSRPACRLQAARPETSAKSCDIACYSGGCDFDDLDARIDSSESNIGGEGGSGRRYRLKLPPSMLRHLNCIRTVEMFRHLNCIRTVGMYKRSSGLFSLKLQVNRPHTSAFHVVWDAETAWPLLSMDALAVLARLGVTIHCLSLGLPPMMKLIVLA